ncbi:hypothetical protein ABQE15_17360, partial [Enterococcus gallinarum]|uniref:hypothetical protein n=1 Tax=Enterococcus gallinarum TaxID=1353 RepID=UPI0032E46D4A
IIGNPSLNHRYRKGFYSLFKTLQQNQLMTESKLIHHGCQCGFDFPISQKQHGATFFIFDTISTCVVDKVSM